MQDQCAGPCILAWRGISACLLATEPQTSRGTITLFSCFTSQYAKKIKGDDLGQTHLIVFSTTSVRHRGCLLSLVVISIVCFWGTRHYFNNGKEEGQAVKLVERRERNWGMKKVVIVGSWKTTAPRPRLERFFVFECQDLIVPGWVRWEDLWTWRQIACDKLVEKP